MFNIKQGSKVELVLDVVASVAIGLLLAVGALSYFDVLTK
tara:strand:+ start:273 stop:392 length:120 start_codon:yes stop_codon:yes gene_type:complete